MVMLTTMERGTDDYAILLCALIRFNIGVEPLRVWVAIRGNHALVGYVDVNGMYWKLDPTWGMITPGKTGWYVMFNDDWVILKPPYSL